VCLAYLHSHYTTAAPLWRKSSRVDTVALHQQRAAHNNARVPYVSRHAPCAALPPTVSAFPLLAGRFAQRYYLCLQMAGGCAQRSTAILPAIPHIPWRRGGTQHSFAYARNDGILPEGAYVLVAVTTWRPTCGILLAQRHRRRANVV